MDKKEEILASYGIDKTSLYFSLEEISMEELEEKCKEMAAKADPDAGKNGAQFALNMKDLWCEIEAAVSSVETTTDEWGYKSPRYWLQDVQDDLAIVVDGNDWKLYAFPYTMDGDNVVVDFADKKRCKVKYELWEDGAEGDPDAGVHIQNIVSEYEGKIKADHEKLGIVQADYDKVKAEFDAMKPMLTLAGTDLAGSLLNTGDAALTTQEAWLQLGLAQSQMAENQGQMAELSAQFVETLGNETTATEEARQIGIDGITELATQYGVSYDTIGQKLIEYATNLASNSTTSSELMTSMATTIQTFSDSAVASLTTVSGQMNSTASSAASMASSIVSSCNQAIAALQKLKSEQKSAGLVKHATGILNSPTTHMATTDELGPEIKIRASSGQYSLIERGDTVIPYGPSENLWKFGMNPDAFIARHVRQMATPNIEITQPQQGGVSVGDVTIQMYGVNDVQSFGEVLERKAASIVAQTFARRK